MTSIGDMQKVETRLAKTITWLLRHGASKEGIKMDSQGYVSVNDLLKWLCRTPDSKVDQGFIQRMVASDSKGRFNLMDQDGVQTIRANQGHSMNLAIQMSEYLPSKEHVIHGTFMEHYDSIATHGLKIMSRQHIHMFGLAHGRDNWHLMRSAVNLYVFVNVAAAQQDGIKFMLSDNGVILSPGIDGVLPPKYLTLVPAYSRANESRVHCYGFIIRSMRTGNYLIVRTPRGQYGFPKGKKVKGEAPLQCALRELYEETGLKVDDITLTGETVAEQCNNKGKLSTPTIYYHGVTSTDIPVRCQDPEELDEVSWRSLTDLRELSTFRESRLQLLNTSTGN